MMAKAMEILRRAQTKPELHPLTYGRYYKDKKESATDCSIQPDSTPTMEYVQKTVLIYGVRCLNASLPVVMATVRLRNFMSDTVLIPLIKNTHDL